MNNPAETLAALAPCPFCGGADIRTGWDDFGWFQVFCGGCNATVEDDVPEKAIAAWNRRASLKGEAVVPALEVFRIAGGDVECCPNPTAAEAMDCLRDLRQCYEESLTTPPAPQAVGEECPHHAWEEVGGWRKCTDCGHGWTATNPTPSPAPQGGGEAVGQLCEGDLSLALRGAQSMRECADFPADGETLTPDGFRAYSALLLRLRAHILATTSTGDDIRFAAENLLATPPAQQPGEVGSFDAWWNSITVSAECPEMMSDRELAKAAWNAALAPKEKGNG